MSPDEAASAAHVESLWRYPVKSMQGETHQQLSVEPGGISGDRAFGVFDETTGTVISAKREGRLLEAAASLTAGELVVTLPDGDRFARGALLDERLSRWLGRPVKLVEAAAFGAATYESPHDFEHDDSPLIHWEGPAGSFHDESPLHLLTTGDLDQLSFERPDLQWDIRRFRPNVLIRAAWTSAEMLVPGRHVRIGDLTVRVLKGCSRCVMTTRPQPNALTRQLDILRHVSHAHDGVVGVRAGVVGTGSIQVGEEVFVET